MPGTIYYNEGKFSICGRHIMLETPLGTIEICIDNKPIEYIATPIPVDKTCKDLDGRYSIQIGFQSDGKEHSISCVIKDHIYSKQDGIETGERLELKSFYKGYAKISIGMEGDTGYWQNGERVSNLYDYDNEYLVNGVSYKIFSTTKSAVYTFGIAWLVNCTDITDVQTWFGADPTIP